MLKIFTVICVHGNKFKNDKKFENNYVKIKERVNGEHNKYVKICRKL